MSNFDLAVTCALLRVIHLFNLKQSEDDKTQNNYNKMSDSNNNLNDRGFACCWPTCSENSYGSEPADADSLSNEDLMLEPGMSSEINGNFNSPISPVMLETFNQNPSSINGEAISPHALLNRHSNWRLGGSPASSVMDATMEWLEGDEEESDMGSLSDYMFDDAAPLNGIRFYNPNYQQPANTDDTMEPTANQANQCLDLRPIPGSIDLTNNQPSLSWRAYQARVRVSASRRLSFPTNQSRSTAGIEMPVVQRLCAGRPRNRHPTPIVYDPEFDSYVYYNIETDSEEEEPLQPPAMVPRRGNSVSDLSQCSSDYEPEQWTTIKSCTNLFPNYI